MPGATARTRAAVARWPSRRQQEQPGTQPAIADLPVGEPRETDTSVDTAGALSLPVQSQQLSSPPPAAPVAPVPQAAVEAPAADVQASPEPPTTTTPEPSVPSEGLRWTGAGGMKYAFYDDGAGTRYIQEVTKDGDSFRITEGSPDYYKILAARDKLLAAEQRTPFAVAGRLLAAGA